jgi:hypothetical protein
MLLRDPYFQLYLLHVAALFVIALWPRISNSQAQPPQLSELKSAPSVLLIGPSSPAIIRHWSLGAKSRDLSRFQELEAVWCAECNAKFSQIVERISLV